MIAVRYIGHRTNFKENIYGTGIAFAPGQTVNIDDDQVANKMLKHTDVYERGDLSEAEDAVKLPKNKVTEDEDPDQTTRDAIANMTKGALVDYAKTHFSLDLDKKMPVDEMRTKVTGMFDQFGIE